MQFIGMLPAVFFQGHELDFAIIDLVVLVGVLLEGLFKFIAEFVVVGVVSVDFVFQVADGVA